jgi:hypothetical protein
VFLTQGVGKGDASRVNNHVSHVHVFIAADYMNEPSTVSIIFDSCSVVKYVRIVYSLPIVYATCEAKQCITLWFLLLNVLSRFV